MRLAKSVRELDGLTFEDLIRRSTFEGAVRHDAVVLLNVEGDETLDGGPGVEAVQEQPGVKRTPKFGPGLKVV